MDIGILQPENSDIVIDIAYPFKNVAESRLLDKLSIWWWYLQINAQYTNCYDVSNKLLAHWKKYSWHIWTAYDIHGHPIRLQVCRYTKYNRCIFENRKYKQSHVLDSFYTQTLLKWRGMTKSHDLIHHPTCFTILNQHLYIVCKIHRSYLILLHQIHFSSTKTMSYAV